MNARAPETLLAPGAPPAPGATHPPGRFRRVLGGLGAALGLSLVFAGALVGSVVVHLDRAPTRRVGRVIANELLGTLFNGKIVVGEIDRLGLHGVAVRSAVALDPRGAQVARIDGLRATVDVIALLRSVLGSGDLRIAVPLVHVDSADVALDRGPLGVPSIAEAFILKKPPSPPAPDARVVRVALDRIEVDHTVAHGQIAPPSPVEATVDHVLGTVQVGPEGVTVDVLPVRLASSAPVPQPVGGDATFHLRLPATPWGTPSVLHLTAGFDGRVGDLETHATATMDGTHLAGEILVPRATPAAIAAMIPGGPATIPLRVPATVTVSARGELPDLAFASKIAFDDGGAIGVDGKLLLATPLRLDAAVRVHAVDPRVVLDVASATKLEATGGFHLEVGSDVHITADTLTEPLVLAGVVIPAVKAQAELEHGVWRGSAEVSEQGAPTRAVFSFDRPTGLRFEVDSRVASLRAITRLRAPLDGAARVKVTGTLGGAALDTLDARITGRVGALRAPGGVELDDATVEGRVHGPVTKLDVEASVTGRGLRAGGYAWEKVAVKASGPVTALRVQTKLEGGGGESIEASGAVDPRTATVRGVRLRVKRADGQLDGEVARVSAGPGGVVLEGVALHGDGVGKLDGGLTIRGKELVGRVRGKDVDLDKVARLAGIRQHLGGLANIDVDLSSSGPGHRKGHIAVELQDGEGPGVSGVSALITAAFDGERVRMDGLVRLVAHAAPGDRPEDRCDGSIAGLRVTGAEGRLAGPLLAPETWRRGTGKLEIAAEDWNLRCLARLAPIGGVLSSVRGKLTARAALERAPGERLPSVRELLVRTRGLELDGPQGDAGPEWDSHGLDVEVTGSIEGATGKTQARVALENRSPIGAVTASATLDLPLLLDHPEQRWASLQKAPMSVRIDVPRRAVGAFGALPSFVRKQLPPLAGEVALDGVLSGSLARPTALVHANAWGLTHVLGGQVEAPRVADRVDPRDGGKSGAGDAKTVLEVTVPAAPAPAAPAAPAPAAPAPGAPPQLWSPWGLPLDLAAVVTCDGQKATLDARVKHDGKEVVVAGADIALVLADLLAGRPVKPTGGLHATLTRAPLGEVPFLADLGIDGHLSGTVALAGVGAAPTLAIDLAMPDLKIGHELSYDKAAVKMDITRPTDAGAGPERGASTTTLELSGKKGGKLAVSAVSAITWKNGLVPVLDDTRPADVTATAARFNIAALLPFVAGALSNMGGYLDGKAHIDWTRRTGGDKPNLSVGMKLTEGLFHIPQFGQELHHAAVSLTSGAGGIVRIEGLHAEGTKGRITGGGLMRFDGLSFARTEAHFSIKRGEELPLTFEGVAFGDARGDINLVAESSAHALAITVGLRHLHVDLPTATARAVQGLDPNPAVDIVQEPRRAAGTGAREASKLILVFNVGQVELKGNLIDLSVGEVRGAPLKIEVAEKARISGDLLIPAGRIEVLHKQFVIEQGIVHMRPEDSANPYVNVTAKWDSPDGPIFITYAGLLLPVTPDKIKYSSPSIPEDRIMATLLFGGVEQSTLGASSAGSAGGLPGQSLAAQLIAQQFSTQIAGNISTSIGANDDGSLRPGLTYNSGDKVIELSTYGATGQGTGASASKGQHTLITIDWRFWRNWLLRGRVDVGSDQTTSGVDVLWQYRY